MREKTTEWCPNCECEVEIDAVPFIEQRCPKCGAPIKACSACDNDICDCNACERKYNSKTKGGK